MLRSDRRTFMLGALAAATCRSSIAGAGDDHRRVPSAQLPQQPRSRDERERIVNAMAGAGIPGAAVCWIDDGQLRWIEGLGVTDKHTNRPIGTDTMFSIQSTSKNLTATAVMLAVQRGIVDLDEPITSYIPDFAVKSRFESNPQNKMTLRILMAHRAGFTHEAPVGNNYDPAFPSFEAHIRSLSQTWLRYPVGERYRYSNCGVDLAGYILQVRMRTPFATCLKILLFDPLAMHNSTAATDTYATHSDRALGHEQGFVSVPLKTPLIPSGGVYTSARDMLTYCQFHLNKGKVDNRTILAEELWQEMHAFPFGGDYSLGVIRTELRYGSTNLRMLSHQGGGFGFGSVFNYCPEAGLAWIAMFNRPTSAGYHFGEQLIKEALSARFGPATPRLPVADLAPIKLPTQALQEYVGNYVARNSTADVVLMDRGLEICSQDRSTSLQFLSPTELFTTNREGDTVSYLWCAASVLAPTHIECFIGENSLDYNHGPHDEAGPDKQDWTQYVGSYRIEQWGREADRVVVRLDKGYLHLNDIRLITEIEPGLFFTSDGEAVDFRQRPPTWKNIRLQREQG